ncbi:MAG: VCBS repeat-containing protein [Candidatus Omnitrophica bacterium]|nr:VCBS repeat-containing protein [Candidatus Omnitrophota bacterium]
MPIRWRKEWISDERYEAVGVFDVDGDGVMDIVSGAYWYQGPEFRQKYFIGEVMACGEYYDDFSVIPIDVNRDGRMDFITGGWFGKRLVWKENPGKPGELWKVHLIAETGNIETTRAWDLDGDGYLEIIPNTPGSSWVKVWKLCEKKQNNFEERLIYSFPSDETQGHGLGAGDIAGNGRTDLVLAKGWLEAPEDCWAGKWRWHPEFDLGRASIPILVVDVDGDGLSDLIVGQAHDYGLTWWQQCRNGSRRFWKPHPIDPFNAQYHDLAWADIDGDGQGELIAGKRHRAHCGKDPGEFDDYGIYYFKWTGESFSKQVICYGKMGETKGCGIQMALADLRGIGRLDLIAPGKDGLYVFFNEGTV